MSDLQPGTCHVEAGISTRKNRRPLLAGRWLPGPSLVVSMAVAVIWLASLTGCSGSGADAPAKYAAKSPDTPELFSIPQEQMSHVQLVTVQPMNLIRTLRLSGAVAYNSFRTTPVITQVSGPVSRVMVVPGQRVTRAQPKGG